MTVWAEACRLVGRRPSIDTYFSVTSKGRETYSQENLASCIDFVKTYVDANPSKWPVRLVLSVRVTRCPVCRAFNMNRQPAPLLNKLLGTATTIHREEILTARPARGRACVPRIFLAVLPRIRLCISSAVAGFNL